MRHVVTPDMVCHLWANQSQSDARNAQGNIYFEGTTIYSYGRHFPMARIAEGSDGPVVLITTQTYSATTSRHKAMVHSASRHQPSILCFDVMADTGNEHNANLTKMRKHCTSLLLRAARARSNAQWRYKEAEECAARHLAYRTAFGKGLDKPLVISDDWKKKAKAQLAEQAEATKQARALKEAQAAIDRLAKLEALEQWKLGKQVTNSFHDLPVALRPVYRTHITGQALVETIQTSRGAEVPAIHARRIWKLVQTIRHTGKAYERNGHTERVGAFVVDSIDAQGTMRAGCHVIEFAAMKELADRLGWPSFDPAQVKMDLEETPFCLGVRNRLGGPLVL